MQTIEYRTVDKSEWPNGAWSHEPDKKQWQDEATGLPCLVVRNRMGALCGYVGVAEGHPAHGKNWRDSGVDSLEVHGGVTYGDHCQPGDEKESICHIPSIGEPDHVWWIGFDCSHFGDALPAEKTRLRKYMEAQEYARMFDKSTDYANPNGTYRDFGYVTRQCQCLARQLKEMSP